STSTSPPQTSPLSLHDASSDLKIVAYAANSESLWPGAIVRGDSVYTGLFTQIVLPRKPMTYSISLGNLNGAKSATMAKPSLSSRSEEHTSELQSLRHLVCRLLL